MAKIKWKAREEIEEEKRKTENPSLEERIEALEMFILEQILREGEE